MSKLWPGEQLSRHPPKQLFSFQLSASQNIRIGTFAFLRGEPICYCCAGKIKDEYACKHKWSVRYPALPQCVLIPLNAPHLALTCPPSPFHPLLILLQLPLLLLDAASITLFLLSHPSPFLRVQSALHLSSSLVLLFTPPFQAKPPFHDDPNTPHTPLSIPLRRMSPWATVGQPEHMTC